MDQSPMGGASGIQQQNLPAGTTPLPTGGTPLSGANLGDIAKMLSGMGGDQQAPPLRPEMAPLGGAGRRPGPLMPPQTPGPPSASAPQGPNSIGAWLASPEGQQLMMRLRSIVAGMPGAGGGGVAGI